MRRATIDVVPHLFQFFHKDFTGELCANFGMRSFASSSNFVLICELVDCEKNIYKYFRSNRQHPRE